MYQFSVEMTAGDIMPYRKNYLDDLFSSVELYLELMIREGGGFLIQWRQQNIGYFILSADHSALLEFHILADYLRKADDVFKTIVDQFKISTAITHSFDHLMMSCCMDFQKSTTVLGYLFRFYQKKEMDQYVFTTKLAEIKDFDWIKTVNEEVFESDDEIRQTIDINGVLLFETEGKRLGFGLQQVIIPGRPQTDIGMLVIPEFRKKGWGTAIIQYLAEQCLKLGLEPTCGCAAENTASRKCLENAGFRTNHRILSFSF